jgi:hypothetical protein
MVMAGIVFLLFLRFEPGQVDRDGGQEDGEDQGEGELGRAVEEETAAQDAFGFHILSI